MFVMTKIEPTYIPQVAKWIYEFLFLCLQHSHVFSLEEVSSTNSGAKASEQQQHDGAHMVVSLPLICRNSVTGDVCVGLHLGPEKWSKQFLWTQTIHQFQPDGGKLVCWTLFFLSSSMLTRRNKELSSAFGVASIGFSAASVQSQCCFCEEFSAVHPKWQVNTHAAWWEILRNNMEIASWPF